MAARTISRSSRHAGLLTYQRSVELYRPRLAGPTELALLHRVEAGDRLDLLAARYFGDPFQYWRIVDANPTLSPDELLQPGRRLRIPRVT